MQRTDEDLLAERRPGYVGDAFAELYRRHEPVILAYFARRVRSAEIAADLMSETFAQALASRSTFIPRGEHAAIRWLFGIARYVLAGSNRRGRVENRARQRLGIERPVIEDDRITAIDNLTHTAGLAAALENLPADQREAIRSFVLEEDDYAAIAARLDCSEAVVRKRVSRGLERLRRTQENTR
jgi:RNA polymerase sigma-70 factor (ECF subfamily)